MLPEAAPQARWLADWWAGRGAHVDEVPDDECDAARFLSALGSSRVLHFSGHGSFNPNVPDETGVVVRGSGAGHAVVSIARMASVDCRRLQLATFFSCWGADSFTFPNHWAVSMPSTLCRAGARAVVAPLWEMEDRVSTELLQAIYARIPEQRIDEAVRAAQLQARLGADGRRRSPFFWAGLQVYGDGGRARLPRRRR
jgi:CHAT domain-containing protein